ncbi:uncharacterized protein LOC120668141 [Panicum virgatum]|uniref:uncharacterized protein LOC120668141 n=1 Tax=Panicum virgatum TaxID=38727 RepID=UPI0019D531BF|nr:uncharacterized protein LOC120668141 [Panicum virgatum]
MSKDPSPMTTEGQRRPHGGHALHPYEQERLRQCMANSARLRELGVSGFSSIFPNNSGTAVNKKNAKHRDNEDSGSEYDPSQDDTDQGDLIGDDNAKGTKEKAPKQTSKERSNVFPGVRFRSRKRVFADQAPTRVTRSKSSITQPDTNLTPSNIHVPPPSEPNDGTQAALEDDGPGQQADSTNITNGGDAIPRHNGSPNRENEDGSTQHDDNTIAGDGVDCITHLDGHDQMTTEEPWDRGVNMGHGLQRLTRAHGAKLPVVITEGNIRPVEPKIAAMYATKCNIAVRNHIPVFKHWKEYKKHPALFELFLGRLRAKFDIDTSNEVVRKGCLEMMQSAVRQQRYKLKKDFFDSVPLHLVRKTSPVKVMSNEQWIDLVDSWMTPQKMEASRKNKENRDDVKFHQTTGSCSYPVYVEKKLVKDEYKDKELDAVDLFKMCHYSNKKKGYTPTVQSAITQMENQLAAPTEDGQPKSATQVVSVVLHQNTKTNHFLRNVGNQVAKRRTTLQNVQAKLEVEKRTNSELQSIVKNQHEEMDGLKNQVQGTEQARIKDQEENRKKQAELEKKIELLLSQNGQS